MTPDILGRYSIDLALERRTLPPTFCSFPGHYPHRRPNRLGRPRRLTGPPSWPLDVTPRGMPAVVPAGKVGAFFLTVPWTADEL